MDIRKGNTIALYKRIAQIFKEEESFTLQDLYDSMPDEKQETLRARVYEKLGKVFVRIGRGLYKVIEDVYVTLKGDNSCITIHGDGRDLSMIKSNSIDAQISDHPWLDTKTNVGGNRSMVKGYNCFRYTQEDFNEKARIMKDGGFLVEILPAENANNYKYLYEIKIMAEKAGFEYYSKVPWIKKGFVSNTGRKAKNSEDILFFTKGPARKLRKDVKKMKATGEEAFMRGTNGMLPTAFEVEPVKVNKRVHASEKPVALIEQIIEYVTLENEVILDNTAGSGTAGESALNKNRSAVLIEILKENINKIVKRLRAVPLKEALCEAVLSY